MNMVPVSSTKSAPDNSRTRNKNTASSWPPKPKVALPNENRLINQRKEAIVYSPNQPAHNESDGKSEPDGYREEATVEKARPLTDRYSLVIRRRRGAHSREEVEENQDRKREVKRGIVAQ